VVVDLKPTRPDQKIPYNSTISSTEQKILIEATPAIRRGGKKNGTDEGLEGYGKQRKAPPGRKGGVKKKINSKRKRNKSTPNGPY